MNKTTKPKTRLTGKAIKLGLKEC